MKNTNQIMLDGIIDAPTLMILDMFSKIPRMLETHSVVLVFISGGSDSDIMLDAIYRMDTEKKARYIYCGTGMEYEATKKHLQYLEEKYSIHIETVDPILPIPTCCRKYGVPFWSKRVSELIYRLQKHNFKWEDRPFEELIQEYPRCRAALRWWCNQFPRKDNGSESALNIDYAPYLKEYMIENPPPMPISAKCCQKAKKEPAAKFEKEQNADLVCLGLRKAEGGNRALKFKSCMTFSDNGTADAYRPIFWLKNEDKEAYESFYGVTHSDCYVIWGMDRTGCPGCPYGKNFEQELELMQKYEPKFYRAAVKVFGASYEYTRGYLEFRKRKQEEERCQEKIS